MKRRVLAVVLALMMLVLAGCSTDGGTSGGGATDAPAAATSAPAANETDGPASLTEGDPETEGPASLTSEEDSSDAGAKQAASYKVTLVQEGNTIFDETLTAEAGQSLLDVMKTKLDIVEDGGYITSMQGIAIDSDAQKWWLFTINGEFAMTGAADTYPAEGDSIVWTYEASTFEE